MTRRDFPESVKRAALARAWNHCEAKDCGQTETWWELRAELEGLGIPTLVAEGGVTQEWLTELRDRILELQKKRPRAFLHLVTRYRLTRDCSMLEVDHIIEDSDGGEPVLSNAQVLCVFCHLEKTIERMRTRRLRAPKVKQKYMSFADRRIADGLRPPRRHTSEAQFQEALQRRELAMLDGDSC